MGEVYSGEQPVIGKRVAIKVLKPEVAADPSNVARMLAEARAVNAIRHPNIVDIFTIGTLPDGRPYLVMDWLEGEPLDRLIKRRGALNQLDTIAVLQGICQALAAAHARRIVHRDLKPANVFVFTDATTQLRQIKLLDFGLAKNVDASTSNTQKGAVIGTPNYIAPEQAKSGTVSAKTDLYSLGVMAFEMLTGRLPFSAPSVVELMMMHVQRPAPRVSSKLSTINPAFDELVAQLLQKESASRPASAEEVLALLEAIDHELREGETKLTVIAPGEGATMPILGMPAHPAPKLTVPLELENEPNSAISRSSERTVPMSDPGLTRKRWPRWLFALVPVAIALGVLAAWVWNRMH